MIDVVYIRGGSRFAPAVAANAGMRYGIRHDYQAYATVWMLDIHWQLIKSRPGEWSRYLDRSRDLKPQQVMAQDFEPCVSPDTLRQQIDDLLTLGVPRVLVCPKRPDWSRWLPDSIRPYLMIAMSVPAPTYAGYPLEPATLAGWRVHLLGGNIDNQIAWLTRINGAGGEVASVDNSHSIGLKAALGQIRRDGKWLPANASTLDLEMANAKAVVAEIRAAENVRQLSLLPTTP